VSAMGLNMEQFVEYWEEACTRVVIYTDLGSNRGTKSVYVRLFFILSTEFYFMTEDLCVEVIDT
jgi:hypothetical protein